MRTKAFLLQQLERCGWSAQLAQDHAEISADVSGSRAVRHEIVRAFHANDQAQLPEADAALRWLVAEPGTIASVGEVVDLIDETTGEVLVMGKPGAVISDPCLVVAFQVGESHDPIEPDDDLGLVAMGLAAFKGRPFRTCHVVAKEHETFSRKSEPFEPAGHAALAERIRSAVGRPRIPCPGDWCGSCRQAPYCESWLARARVAMTTFGEDTGVTTLVAAGADAVVEIPQLDLTNENAGPFALRIKLIEKALEFAKAQRNSFARNGGRIVVNGKQLHLSEVGGRETVSADALRDKVADLLVACEVAFEEKRDALVLRGPISALRDLVKVGKPFETSRWKKVESAAAARKR